MLRNLPCKILFIALIVNLNIAFGQDYVEGEIIVQLRPKSNISQFLSSFNQNKLNRTGVTFEHEISKYLRIYKLSFDEKIQDGAALINEISARIEVQNAQFNHKLELRETVPNDPEYENQWQYDNTGQSGGTVGADIDADLAWDITTGGLTTQNDTIVVCVIDGGFQTDHPDLAQNIWVNRAEIIGDGIDNDNNGFIDDYRGWNTGTQTDDVSQGDDPPHGTAVAGIVGAVGNNQVGVAGVNWDVKLMLVSGGTGLESEVLEAYSYAYSARRRYNETNGEEGAFVVSTNASWGVDGGQASDAPIWCSFYDSLGVIGILSAGATINGNENVDVFGDLPTTCSSEFLVAVTNINDNDEKVDEAGFGVEHIDIGAFGEGTWTTAIGSTYDGFGGTSGATPHVAGAIALLYSAPCNAFVDLSKSDPAFAALKVKEYILSGGDSNASLEGITKTGNRLNLNNSLNLLIDNCSTCLEPNFLSANVNAIASAELNWLGLNSAFSETLRWRVLGSNDWIIEENVSSPFVLENLDACTMYEFSVSSTCVGLESNFSDSFVFESEGCCINPSLGIVQIDSFSVNLEWPEVLAAESFNFVLLDMDGVEVSTFSSSDNQLLIENLEECTEYSVRIQSICGNNQMESDSEISFTTRGCGSCLDFEYCPGEFLIGSSSEWIESIKVDDQLIVTGNQGVYTNFENQFSLALEVNESFDLTINAGNEYGDPLNFSVWIDFDGNGSFDNDELMVEQNSVESIDATIFVPSDAKLGLTRMRIVVTFGELINACEWEYDPFGEVEDYCLNIGGVKTSTNQVRSGSEISVYPNPFKNTFLINLNNENYKTVDIYNSQGVLMDSIDVGNMDQLNLDNLDYSSGLYIVRAQTVEGLISTAKVFKSN